MDRCSRTDFLLPRSWIRRSPRTVQLQQAAQQLLRVSESVMTLKSFQPDTWSIFFSPLLELCAMRSRDHEPLTTDAYGGGGGDSLLSIV